MLVLLVEGASLTAAGLQTRILPTPGPENERNTLFLAAARLPNFDKLRSPLLNNGRPVPLDSLFFDPARFDGQPANIFADDRPDLDRLILPAAAIWRKGYNDTYPDSSSKTAYRSSANVHLSKCQHHA